MTRDELLASARMQITRHVARRSVHTIIDMLFAGCNEDEILAVFEQQETEVAEAIVACLRELEEELDRIADESMPHDGPGQ